MKIISANFIKGIIGTDDILYDGKFQVAFMGRSNVGKSTLINSLVGRRNLARSSSTPGKTVRMDFFLINDKFYFVDLPGFGYAKRSGKIHEKLRKMMLWYLMYAEVKNRLAILIIDAKVGISDYDQEALQMFKEHEIPFIIVGNKIDNVDKNQRVERLAQISRDADSSEVISYSSKMQSGKNALWSRISPYVS